MIRMATSLRSNSTRRRPNSGKRPPSRTILPGHTFSAGNYNLLARAIDGLGATADSTQIAIVVGSLPQLRDAQVVANHFQFTVRSDPGSVFQVERSNDLKNWSQVGSLTNDTGTATFQDPSSLTSASGFYRLRQQ
jgi:hypothetical protein